MFRRKTKSRSSFLPFPSSNRGSDITKPDNTSLIVNQSDTETDDVLLPKELTSIFSDDEDNNLDETTRRTSSLMKSLSQKKQSTPLNSQSQPEESRPSQKLKFKDCQLLNKFNTNSQTKKVSFFEEVLKTCGATPLSGNSSYLMSEDQAVFSIKVNKKLSEDPENIQKFIDELKEYIKDCENLQKMLAHTLTAENCEVARGPVQEPLMRMLLNVDCLRTNLIELLLNAIAEFTLDNKVESEKLQLVSSVLRQMRFLNGKKNMKLASKLFEIIYVASINVKREIIFLLPEIVPEEEAEETCSQLLELLKFDEVLTQVIIDAMTNLPLNKTLRRQVCAKILTRLDKSPLEFLPSLVQFIVNKSDAEEHTEMINGLRKNLPFTRQHYQMKEKDKETDRGNSDENSYVKLTFENLKFSVMASKQMADTWIKIISNLQSPNDFRCVDWVMLVIFYSCLFGKKSQVLQIIRNKVKSSVLNRTQLQDMFKMLFVIAEEYCSHILELASALLKSFEQKLSDFGSSLYKECFIHFHFYMKQIVISEILLHIGTGSPAAVNTALGTMKDLCAEEKEALSLHTASILGLLVKVQDLDLSQVRLLMDVIAELAFFESGETAVQDELQIFLRKQLMSSKCDQYKKGISGAIMFVKHSVGNEDSCAERDTAQINALLEMAMGSNWSAESKRGFFNDEFATMLKESRLNKSFVEVWSKKIWNLATENLFVKNIDVECSDFPMSLQYSLREELQKFVFPVVAFIVKSNDNESPVIPISVIPSTLRLLWCLEDNRERVLPAFHAAVIMPESTIFDNFDSLEEPQKNKIMNCLFLCGNYLIECVNALCAHGKVLETVLRLKQLIQVRKLIARHIKLVSEFVPPVCQFYAPTQKVVSKKKISEKKAKRGRKRKLEEAETSNSFSGETQHTMATPAVCNEETVAPSDLSTQEADLRAYSQYFRELDFLTYKLLAINLKSEKKPVRHLSSQPVDQPELETCDILFLLEDLICKSEQILKSTEAVWLKTKAVTSLIQKMAPESFIEAAIELLPGLLNKMETFSKYCEHLLEANDWVYDSRGLHLQEACYVKLAMAAALKFIAEVISWKGFQNSNNLSKLFREFMTILSKKECPNDANISLKPLDILAGNAAKYLATFSKTVLTLPGALSIIKSVQTCLRCSSEENGALADLCAEFLCRSWLTASGALERGSVYNQHIDFLLKTYFSSVERKLEVVRTTAKVALDEVGGLTAKDSTLKTFKTINKGNFPLLYRTLCEALVSASTAEISEVNGNDDKGLEIWNKIVETLLVLVETAKSHSSRAILASLLKRSQSVIQLFLSKGMNVVQSALRVKSVEVLTLLKSFQIVTRFLHSICCHSRITNDSLVAAHVPAIRSQCERLTLEVKGMLILNGIPMDCITIAILKNKDIKGNDIISQESLDNDSDDDSELPPEDTPDVEEDLQERKEETADFNSESY